jgi:alpha-glucosidase
MYKSPQDDNGYDVSDYQGIQPEFGTMEDFDELLKEVHRRGMRLIIDLVVNHTSDEHAWFEESRSSRSSPKRDWYIWRDGRDGREPNNWESIFGGSAWALDEKTGQYYMHLFSAKQPDLNWENPEMRQAVYQMIRWWLDKGVDGFRIDAISHIRKEPGFPDLPNPQNLPYVPSFSRHMNIPGIHDYIDELCRETFQRYDVVTVGEANGVSASEAEEWVGESRRKFNMLFQFEHLDLWSPDPASRIDLPKVRTVFSRYPAHYFQMGRREPLADERAVDRRLLLFAARHALHLPGPGNRHDEYCFPRTRRF